MPNLKHTTVLTSKPLNRFLKFRENEPSRVLLIGKDGGVKLRGDELDVQRIFDLIDTMPMRIREMKNN